MAKYECRLRTDFDEFLSALEKEIGGGSVSVSFEDGSDYAASGVRCAVRVYERYSWTGSNRVSLSLTLLGSGDELFLTAITSGGSQAVFFKLNTIGEGTFLDQVVRFCEHYRAERGQG